MSINVQDVAKAVNTWLAANTTVLKADFGRATSVTLDKYAKKLTKIKGNYPQFHSILTHVVQGFRPQWDALGEAEFKHKVLQNFQQKVNFPIIPAEILSTFLAELYEEGKKPTDMAIAKHIIDWLLLQVQEDLEVLSVKGVYDADHAHGEFGYSLNGIEQSLTNALAHATHPAYKIPVNALTDDNIVEEITAFERKIPKRMKKKVKQIHMSENNAERYALNYEDLYGSNTTYKDGDVMKTRLGKREIVAHPDLADDKIFGSIDGNLVKLVDVIDNPPTITDVQVQDYVVKIFMEFWLGYDFLINEAVFVANFTDEDEGLGDDELMALYYPSQEVA
jgi:hypothetical protein